MQLTQPEITNQVFRNVFSKDLLQTLPCGLHRATLIEANKLLPELRELYHYFPDEVLSDLMGDMESWFIDIKITMLMKGQYPCIPNWHCDNVPRNNNGELEYGNITQNSKPMYLWLSGEPLTEFLAKDYQVGSVKDHGELDKLIKGSDMLTRKLPQETWVKMWQNTPHRGTVCKENTWRVFVRLTHKSLVGEFLARQKVNPLRRHSQVYLPHDFNW